MKRAIAAILCSLAPSFAGATGDLTDLWYDPADPGWGLGVFQQGEILFVTLFTYDAAGRPAWYVGSDVRFTGVDFDPCGTRHFTGRLYAMTGGAFGGAGAAPQARDAGRITGSDFVAGPCSPDLSVTLEIDGRSMQRRLTRQTWAVQRLDGSYRGFLVSRGNGCTAVNVHGRIEVATQGAEAAITFVADPDSTQLPVNCTWRGTYRQAGRRGELAGVQYCQAALEQPRVTIRDLTADENAFSGLVTPVDARCPTSARLGGVRVFP